jgi:predicted lysophospholipase L1 biosynthesis ABC-type transport system permease subunit
MNGTRLVSEAMSRLAWPGEDPLGKSMVIGDSFTVVGISGDVRATKFGESDTVHAYFPIEDGNRPSLTVLVRTAGAPTDISRGAMTVARTLDPNTFPTVETLSSAHRTNLQGAEYSAVAVSALGSIAQFLACLGIVGVVSYAVSQRTKEIGIRMALGARPAHVMSVVLRHLSLPVVIGLITGVAGGAALSQFLRGRLYGISNLDPTAYVAAVVVFLATVAIAAVVPARKALRVDPLHALRHE